ncbi:Biotin carboxyl carrier protein of acetyl-CoA carboxylase [Streptococcus sp. DD10]|uniref:acetyl-CoA carboxylase biotin carboxyl carrier protein n=1 Tax=Streptococcus sp. DD10 TaxID=1777878 RepID=UPI000794BFDC|nr:acetyl-CoA carboxylase biotin carboxyl carrier protein [Streptococcus sp. DD10]KXT74541.1 Biotin carboxyl carrier protein of acetyl-CoA carboxylase [Streptococcus sp. DD10]
MNVHEIKDLMGQFDQSSLREFTYKHAGEELHFSKNEGKLLTEPTSQVETAQAIASVAATPNPVGTTEVIVEEVSVSTPNEAVVAEGELVECPLVGVAYLAAGPDKPNFVNVGDAVQKGQTLLIIEAMKVMNEIPAPKDGIITEVLVQNEEMVEFGKGLVRIK